MKVGKTGPSGRVRRLAGAVAPLVPAGALYLLLTAGTVGLSPDSVFYWSAAREFAEHGRLATRIAYPDVAERIGSSRWRPTSLEQPVPLTTWPPAYPIAIALTMRSLRLPASAAAQVVNLFAVAMTLIVAGTLASRMIGRVGGAIVASWLGVLAGVQEVTGMVWSEPLFGYFVLLTLLCVARWLEARGRRREWLALAVVTAAAATYTRYAGVSLYGLILLAAGPWRRQREQKTAFGPAGWAAIFLYPVLILPLVVRNAAITGHLSGAPREEAGSLLNAAVSAGLGLLGSVAPLARGVTPGPEDLFSTLGYSLAAWLGALLLIAGVLWWYRDRGLPRFGVVPTQPAAHWRRVVLGFAVVYVLFATALIWLWRVESGPRFFYPSVICFALVAFAEAIRRFPGLAYPPAGVAAGGVLACLTFLSLSRVDSLTGGRKGYNSPRFLNLAEVALIRRELADTPAPHVWTDRWRVPLIHFATGRPVARLPNLDQMPAVLVAVRAPQVVALLGEHGDEAAFECREYREAYERVLDAVAMKRLDGPGFRAWWLQADEGSRTSLQKQVDAINVASLCSVAPGRPGRSPVS